MRVTVLVGNPRPASRTREVAEAAVRHLLADAPTEPSLSVVELCEHASVLFDPASEPLPTLRRTVAESELLVVASPTYKATYTGLLKAFFDGYPGNGLAGVPAIPVMTGADTGHALGAETGLRPLLVELGATVPTRALYFVTSRMDELDELVGAWASEQLRGLRRLAPLLDAVGRPAAADAADGGPR